MKDSKVNAELKKAIVQLLNEKPIYQISVTDLIKKAGVARASFYRNYATIDEVVDAIVVDMKESFAKKLLPSFLSRDRESIKRIIRDFFVAIKEDRVPLINVLPENSPFVLEKLQHNSVFTKDQKFATLKDKYVPGLYLISIITISRIWKFYGYEESPEDLADFAYRIIYRDN